MSKTAERIDIPAEVVAERGYWSDAFRRFRRDRVAQVAGLIIILLILASAAAPWITEFDPLRTHLLGRLRPPSTQHWFGQDEVGRDIFSRVLYGGRVSLAIGVLSVGFGLIVGGVLGAVAGFFPKTDNLIMRFIDIILAFPFILRAIAVVVILGPGFINLFVAIGFGRIPPFARLIRGLVVTIKEEVYVEAAMASGATNFRILAHHILPQMVAPIITYSTLEIGTSILAAASLSFLGLGVQQPSPEWGALAATGREFLRNAPHVVLFPAMAIFLTAWSFNILGDALRDALDPKLRGR